jgi:hypothetical protein
MSKETLEILFEFIKYINEATLKEKIVLRHDIRCKLELLESGV